MLGQQLSADNFLIDMFGRQKISSPQTLFDSSHRYRSSVNFSDEVVGVGSGVSYLANESTDLLTVGTASGCKVTRESTKVFQYQPGKSLQVLQTFVMAPHKNGLLQRVGFFSRTNGVFLELDDEGTLCLVMRTYTSGAVEEFRVTQDNWDRRKMKDGDGPTLDMTAAQIFFMEFEWLGVGSVRCGFIIGGEFYTVHQFDHANWIKKVYMQTASLPVRYEIENTATTSSPSSMKQICATVISNGGYDWERLPHTAIRNTEVGTNATNYVPVVAIRMKEGRTDSIVIPDDYSILPTLNGDYNVVLLKNPTLTGGTWVDSDTGNVQYNIGATAVSGGTVLHSDYVSSSNQSRSQLTFGGGGRIYFQLGRTNATTPVSDVLVLAVKSVAATTTGGVIGSLSWFDNT